MRTFRFLSAMSAAVLCTALPVSAEGWFDGDYYDPEGDAFGPSTTYAAFFLGASFPEDTSLTGAHGFTIPASASNLDLDDGWAGGLAIGTYSQDHPLRYEVELAYREFDIDGVSVAVNPAVSGSGDVDALSVMANLYTDIEVTDAVEFYLGGGVGLTRIEGDYFATDGAATLAFGGNADWVVTYQVMVGVAMQVRERVKLTAGYRGLTFEDPQFDSGFEYNAPWVDNLEVGIRVSF